MTALSLVTIVDNRYAPGLAALLQSLDDNAAIGRRSMTVFLLDALSDDVRAALGDCDTELEFFPLAELGTVPPRSHTRGRRRSTIQKLLVVGMPTDRTTVFVDSDMLCLSDLTGIERWEHFTAAVETVPFGQEPTAGSQSFNTGLFAFDGDPNLREELVQFYLSPETRFVLGDQPVCNRVMHTLHPDDVRLVDPVWNANPQWIVRNPERSDEVRFLHFTAQKPWLEYWRPRHDVGRELVELYRVWWSYYARSPVARVLPLAQPPWLAVRVSHARAARPLWRGAQLARAQVSSVRQRLQPPSPS